jgi:hypothetical protein
MQTWLSAFFKRVKRIGDDHQKNFRSKNEVILYFEVKKNLSDLIVDRFSIIFNSQFMGILFTSAL